MRRLVIRGGVSEQPVVKVDVSKNRVQPPNSLQAKCFVFWVMTGCELVAAPIFRNLHFYHGLLARF